MSRDTELLTEIRDLLQVMAEPMLAKRDERFRGGIRKVAGKSEKTRKAIVLMDGTRTQATIAKEAGMDHGQLSRVVKMLEKEVLCVAGDKRPKLAGKLPQGFFDENGGADE